MHSCRSARGGRGDCFTTTTSSPLENPPRTAKLPTAAPLPLLIKPDEQQLIRQGQEGGLGAHRGCVPPRTPPPAPPRLGLGTQGGLCPAVIYWGGAGRKTSISRSGAQHEPGSQQRGDLPAPSPDAASTTHGGLPGGSRSTWCKPELNQVGGTPASPPCPEFPSVKRQDEGRAHTTPGRMRPQGMGGGRGALHGSIPAV